jgi:hypothetical protein
LARWRDRSGGQGDQARAAAELGRTAEGRFEQALTRERPLTEDDAPEGEVRQADREARRAIAEFVDLWTEQQQREASWHARLRREVRWRTGW